LLYSAALSCCNTMLQYVTALLQFCTEILYCNTVLPGKQVRQDLLPLFPPVEVPEPHALLQKVATRGRARAHTHIHTHTYTHTHARTHARKHTHSQTHTHKHTHASMMHRTPNRQDGVTR
jgi:hypothetical protein